MEQYIAHWREEERIAHIKGWDFSHIHGKYEEGMDLPWDYETVVRAHLRSDAALLDIDTGGGEFLLSLHHPYRYTSATEAYPPNVRLCQETLTPLGIDFRESWDYANLPFPDQSFDLILNRHGDYHAPEILRLLKPGGYFITQQVGEWNDRELVELLLPGTPRSFSGWNLDSAARNLRKAGLTVMRQEEAFRSIRFYDVGALVWFARVIEWEFPGFCVDGAMQALCDAQRKLDENGALEGRTHRFLLVAQRPPRTDSLSLSL